MLEQQTLQFTQFLEPLIGLGITAIIVLWMKEAVGDFVASIRWKMKPGFEPGDVVFLDGEEATIVSIGFRETIFEIDNGRGKVWRYIYNKRIPIHKLEKVIVKKTK
jgi:hypothetical protein|tara:strand:- start:488 stop:805 length:318 start_codon:yes stop_codon:yes gene_type:complete